MEAVRRMRIPVRAARLLTLIAMAAAAPAPATAQNLPSAPVAPAPPDQRGFTAAEIRASIGYCIGRTLMQERLQCFEAMAAALGFDVIATVDGKGDIAASGPSNWTVETARNERGQAYSIATVPALDVVAKDAIFASTAAALTLRCEGRQASLYVSFDKPVAERSVEALLTLDGGKTIESRWQASESGLAVGLWVHRDATALAKRLTSTRSFSVTVTRDVGSALTAAFLLEGMDDAVADMRKLCRW